MTKKQRRHCKEILSQFGRDFVLKYERGQAEHGGNLWERVNLLDEAWREALDLIAYLGTLRLKQQEELYKWRMKNARKTKKRNTKSRTA